MYRAFCRFHYTYPTNAQCIRYKLYVPYSIPTSCVNIETCSYAIRNRELLHIMCVCWPNIIKNLNFSVFLNIFELVKVS